MPFLSLCQRIFRLFIRLHTWYDEINEFYRYLILYVYGLYNCFPSRQLRTACDLFGVFIIIEETGVSEMKSNSNYYLYDIRIH